MRTELANSDVPDESVPVPPVRSPFMRAVRHGWNKWIYPRFVLPFRASKEPPWFDARGVSVGLFIGFVVPVGGQVLLISFLRLIFRFNSLLAIACSLVSNPFNCIPLYYGYYLLGSCIIGASPRINRETFDTMMQAVVDSGHLGESLSAFLHLSGDFLIRWSIAALILGVSSAILGYLVTYSLKSRMQKRRQRDVRVTDNQSFQPQKQS